MLGSLPEELQLTERVEFVADVSGKPMPCYMDRNWQIQLLCGTRLFDGVQRAALKRSTAGSHRFVPRDRHDQEACQVH